MISLTLPGATEGRHGHRQRGITLVEVLVALAIFSMVITAVMRFGDYVTRRIFTVRNEIEQLDGLVTFLKTLSADVRGGRQVLYSSPAEIGIWRADENADSFPQAPETVGYAWDGLDFGHVIRQSGEDTTLILKDVRDLKFTYDQESPNTRHVVLELTLGKTAAESRFYHFSVNLRASELH